MADSGLDEREAAFIAPLAAAAKWALRILPRVAASLASEAGRPSSATAVSWARASWVPTLGRASLPSDKREGVRAGAPARLSPSVLGAAGREGARPGSMPARASRLALS